MTTQPINRFNIFYIQMMDLAFYLFGFLTWIDDRIIQQGPKAIKKWRTWKYYFKLHSYSGIKNQQDLCAEHMKLLMRKYLHKLYLWGWPPKVEGKKIQCEKTELLQVSMVQDHEQIKNSWHRFRVHVMLFWA